MHPQFKKLVTLLQELFQLDQPDLDFGLYRVMHAKSTEVSNFLQKDLLPQVQTAFAGYRKADKGELEKALAKIVADLTNAGVDPESSPKVKELRAKIATEAVDVGALEQEVYDHLYGFFRRYYSEGDFLSKRVYKPGVYSIPYAGEEVTLHWANKDQYYIKTNEYLRDYAFRLRPNDPADVKRVHFRLVDVAEGEHGNVKAVEGKERRFSLASENPIVEESGELIIRFTYQPNPAKQKELNDAAEQTILAHSNPVLASWINDLSQPHQRSDGTSSSTRLSVHLNRYTARNSFDYFIHKDLGSFLRRELDFYIKNEVMALDDIESDTAPRVEQYLSKIKVVRKIAHKIIDFLAQLEDFQKKLWLKKKFVVETSYCVLLRIIPLSFHAEILANAAQRLEWEQLGVLSPIEGDALALTAGQPLTTEFLTAHPTLMIDTRHFSADFTGRLLDTLSQSGETIDSHIDGVLCHSENFQALSLMQTRYREQVKCIYIDPPYNTGGDGFAYKDNYPHSSWMSMIHNRVSFGVNYLSQSGSHFCSIDDRESYRLRFELEQVFGEDGFLGEIIWQKRYAPDVRTAISDAHEYVLAFARDSVLFKSVRNKLPLSEVQTAQFKNVDNDERGPWKAADFTAPGFRPNQMYEITTPTGRVVSPPAGRCWGVTEPVLRQYEQDKLMYFGADGNGLPAVKRFLKDMDGMVPWTWWTHQEVGHSQDGLKVIMKLFGREEAFLTAKPPALIERVARIATSSNDIMLDYFAGSGTTGQALINLNREDGGQRKCLLVEMGDHFDTVLVPRLKKVAFTPEWKDGKPQRLATDIEAERSPRILKIIRLESYEDTLNNLQLLSSKAQQETITGILGGDERAFHEQFMLRYLLNVETRGSQSLLNVQAFNDPTAYTLTVKRPGSDESRAVNVDLIETFHWLLGLTVHHLAAPQTFNARFNRDEQGRLRLDGNLKLVTDGQYWFRAITGTMPDGRKTLIIWRKLTGEVEQDNAVLDAWFTKQNYSARDSEFNLIYVNGGNNLENLKTGSDTWKVRLIEEDFQRLMFDTAGG